MTKRVLLAGAAGLFLLTACSPEALIGGLLNSAGGPVVKEAIVKTIRQSAITKGATPAQADCVAAAVGKSVSLTDILAAAKAGAADPKIAKAVNDAMAVCGTGPSAAPANGSPAPESTPAPATTPGPTPSPTAPMSSAY